MIISMCCKQDVCANDYNFYECSQCGKPCDTIFPLIHGMDITNDTGSESVGQANII